MVYSPFSSMPSVRAGSSSSVPEYCCCVFVLVFVFVSGLGCSCDLLPTRAFTPSANPVIRSSTTSSLISLVRKSDCLPDFELPWDILLILSISSSFSSARFLYFNCTDSYLSRASDNSLTAFCTSSIFDSVFGPVSLFCPFISSLKSRVSI